MAVDEDKIKLLLELLGFEKVDSAIADLQHMKGAATGAQDALESVSVSTAQVGKSLQGAKFSLADYRQNLTALGYTVNDFTSVQGDLSQRLNAIANNLPMLLAGFGGLGLALSALVPVIGLVIKNWDHIVEAFTGETAIIKTTGTLAEMKDTLKEVNAQVEALGKTRFESLADAEKYNKLVADQLALEKNITAEIKRQKDLAAYKTIQPEKEKADEKAGAKQLQAALATSKEEIENAVAEGLRQGASSEYLRLQKLANRQVHGSEEQRATMQQLAVMRGRMGNDPAAFEANATEAKELLARAAASGKAEDLERVAKLTHQARGGDRLSPAAQMMVDRATPAGLAKSAAEAEATKERDKALDRDLKLMQDKADEGRKEDERIEKLNETLTRQGQENEEAGKRISDQKDAERIKDDDEIRKRFNRRRDETVQRLDQSPLDEAATAAAATYRAQGGVMGRDGRVQKADESGQLAALVEDLVAQIRLMMPNLTQTQANAVATRMATRSFEQVDATTQDRAAMLARPGLQVAQTGGEQSSVVADASQRAAVESTAQRQIAAMDAMGQQLTVAGQQADQMAMMAQRMAQLQAQAAQVAARQARVDSVLATQGAQMPPIMFGWPN